MTTDCFDELGSSPRLVQAMKSPISSRSHWKRSVKRSSATTTVRDHCAVALAQTLEHFVGIDKTASVGIRDAFSDKGAKRLDIRLCNPIIAIPRAQDSFE